MRQIGRRVAAARLCEAEIERLDETLRRDFDVRRLQVAMDDAFVVGRLQCFGNLAGDGKRFSDRESVPGVGLRVQAFVNGWTRANGQEPSACYFLAQRLPIHQLENQEPNSVGFFEAV